MSSSTLIFSELSHAGEEPLDLSTEAAPMVQAVEKVESQVKLMGRLDLTAEYGNPNPSSNPEGGNKSKLDNNHMLVFLKLLASKKTSVMAEVAGQKFFYATYQGNWFQAQFGKILVPFGDNRRFHLMYGGIQGYGPSGVMFPNIWAEPGVNLTWKLGVADLETYLVNSIAASSETVDADLQVNTDQVQALGARYTRPILSGWNVIGSYYRTEYLQGRSLEILGLNTYSEYGAGGMPNFLRLNLGFAKAFIKENPVSGSFEKSGDYIELQGKGLGPGELRLRYGTYIHNSKVKSKRDVHNWNLGYNFEVDVINVLVEHQLNFEAMDEVKNDLTRLMVSVNF